MAPSLRIANRETCSVQYQRIRNKKQTDRPVDTAAAGELKSDRKKEFV
jgi:hypothetical protein